MVQQQRCGNESDVDVEDLLRVDDQEDQESTTTTAEGDQESDTMAPAVNNQPAPVPASDKEMSVQLEPKDESRKQNEQNYSNPNVSSENLEKRIEDIPKLDGSIRSPSSPCNHVSQIRSQEATAVQMLIPPCFRQNSDLCNLLTSDMKMPPVTTATLNELDLQWIQNNIHLRIDVNYDHDLHFMPVSGSRGERKREYAKKYWLSLAAEFRIYAHDNLGNCDACRDCGNTEELRFDQKLPIMFQELRDVLETLVPDRDRDQVINNLDVELLMQQTKKGILDVVQLSDWLATLLTSHCAPMRDQWAEEMAQQITDGARHGDMVSLVAGLEKLFSFLEAMKLDIANHLIRAFRYPLIEDTVAFQQDYFTTRIREKKLDISRSKVWFESLDEQHRRICTPPGSKRDTSPFSSFIHGLVEFCAAKDKPIPLTLKHDLNRIHQLREEVQDILHVDMCLDTFDQLTRRLICTNSEALAMHPALQSRILDLTDGSNEGGSCIADIWLTNVDSVAMEITRAAYSVSQYAECPIPHDEYNRTGQWLRHRFITERTTHELAKGLIQRLEQETSRYASSFQRMSSLTISETQKRWQQSGQRVSHLRYLPDVEDAARRLAHIAVIHWRVWASLAYLDPPAETEDSTDEVLAILSGFVAESESDLST